jgi:hypothetical protein
MYNVRIIEGSIDFWEFHGALFVRVVENIATRYMTKIDKKKRLIGLFLRSFIRGSCENEMPPVIS